MSTDSRFERLLADALAHSAPEAAPAELVPDILATASRTRRRPRWLTLATERPMRRQDEVLVGSPTLRRAYVVGLAILLALLAVGAFVGSGIVRPPDLASSCHPARVRAHRSRRRRRARSQARRIPVRRDGKWRSRS